jgi:hypothetical protein
MSPSPESLATLERQRTAILSEILQLGDFRSSSITAISLANRLMARTTA